MLPVRLPQLPEATARLAGLLSAVHLILQVAGQYINWVYQAVNVIHRGFHALGF